MRAFMLAGAPNVETKANWPPRRRADRTQHGITLRWTRGATVRFSTNLSDSKLSLPRARVNSTVGRLRSRETKLLNLPGLKVVR